MDRVNMVVRMILFCTLGALLAFLGERQLDLYVSCCFVILAGNELAGVVWRSKEIHDTEKPKSRSRRQVRKKKESPVKRYFIKMLIGDVFVVLIAYILYVNGVEAYMYIGIGLILGVTLLSAII